jgi:hypothetical protein
MPRKVHKGNKDYLFSAASRRDSDFELPCPKENRPKENRPKENRPKENRTNPMGWSCFSSI